MMLWDFLNSIIRLVSDVLHGVYSVLPQSPIYVDSATASELGPVLGHVAWFFPVSGMAAFLVLYIVAVITLAGVLLIKQLIESAIP